MRWTYEDHKREAANRESIAQQRRQGTLILQVLRRGSGMRRTNR